MHVAWSAVFSPPDGGAAPSIEDIRARVTRRLGWVPRCRQRLLPAPLGLSEPRWVDDAGFDVAAHVVQLTERDDPVGPERFAQLRDALLSTPLDRSRPLWQLAFVPRLADGRLGVVGRVHHAMADGAAALQIALLTIDIDGHAGPAPTRGRAVGGRGAADDAAARARPARPRRRADLRAPRATSCTPPPIRAPPPATRCATPAGSSPPSPRTCCRTRPSRA